MMLVQISISEILWKINEQGLIETSGSGSLGVIPRGVEITEGIEVGPYSLVG